MTRRGFAPLRYMRAHPFSTMALCNIVGDSCYLGYAFAADGFVSYPKLVGALFNLWAHAILLAYGDERANVFQAERGKAAELLLLLRHGAQKMTAFLPLRWIAVIRRWPVGISFTILSLNGLAFIIDGLLRFENTPSLAMMDQTIMGALVTLGLTALASADFVKGQRLADFLTKAASFILGTASVLNIILAVTTLNFFVMVSVVAFAISNITVYFARLDKRNIPVEPNV